uniref:HTH_7 domain-containing protein n=1 Tax=Meloidogyne hapla TaxID=6305 RepID=A0A1I8BVN8_MELHA
MSLRCNVNSVGDNKCLENEQDIENWGFYQGSETMELDEEVDQDNGEDIENGSDSSSNITSNIPPNITEAVLIAHKAKLNKKEIARMLKIGIAAVEEIKEKSGINRKKILPEDFENICKLLEQGMNYKDIGGIYGVECSTIGVFIRNEKKKLEQNFDSPSISNIHSEVVTNVRSPTKAQLNEKMAKILEKDISTTLNSRQQQDKGNLLPEDYKNILKLLKLGKTLNSVAKIYGVDSSSVRQFVKDNVSSAISKKKKIGKPSISDIPPIIIEAVLIARKAKYSLEQISKMLKINRAVLTQIKQQFELGKVSQKLFPEDYNKIVELLEQGKTYDEIGHIFGAERSTVSFFVRKRESKIKKKSKCRPKLSKLPDSSENELDDENTFNNFENEVVNNIENKQFR